MGAVRRSEEGAVGSDRLISTHHTDDIIIVKNEYIVNMNFEL